MTEKDTPISRALIAATKMPAPQARRVLMLICEAGMTLEKPAPQEPTEGEKHFAKREKFIQRMDATCKRVIKYAKHETLRNIERHFRANSTAITSAEGDETPGTRPSLAARLTFNRTAFGEELLAALREDQESALGTAGQQLFDELGKDSVWRLPSQDALQFVQVRANLLANVPDEIHREIMTSIEQGLAGGESRRQLMARISTAFDEIGKSRAETIANTETAAAFNYSRDKAMREAGVTHKRWLHSMSPLIKEPRPTHLEADGQTVAIDDPFDVGGVRFMMPTDDSLGAGPEDIINCHCVSIAVEAPIESGEGEGHPFRGNQYTTGESGEPELRTTERTNPEFVAKVKEHLDTHLSRFPTVKKELKLINFTDKSGASAYVGHRLKSEGGGIELNFANFASQENPLKFEVGQRIHQTLTKDLEGTVRHEIGHMVHDVARDNLDDLGKAQLYELAKQAPKISNYATKNASEAIAENFDSYLSGNASQETKAWMAKFLAMGKIPHK